MTLHEVESERRRSFDGTILRASFVNMDNLGESLKPYEELFEATNTFCRRMSYIGREFGASFVAPFNARTYSTQLTFSGAESARNALAVAFELQQAMVNTPLIVLGVAIESGQLAGTPQARDVLGLPTDVTRAITEYLKDREEAKTGIFVGQNMYERIKNFVVGSEAFKVTTPVFEAEVGVYQVDRKPLPSL